MEDDTKAYQTTLQHVLAELARLDLLLRLLMERADAEPEDAGARAEETDAGARSEETDAGLAEAERLAGEIGERSAAGLDQGAFLRLVVLARLFGLTRFDVDVIVICLAPEIDRRYERLYAHLQDDATLHTPTVELVLDLLYADLPTRIAARARFGAGAPLLRHRLVTLTGDASRPAGPLLTRSVALDPRIARFLLEDDEPEPLLRPYARLVEPVTPLDRLVLPAGLRSRLAGLAGHLDCDLVLHFHGPAGTGKRTAAAALSHAWGADLLVVDAESLAGLPEEDFTSLVALADREARLLGAIMYWENADALLTDRPRRAAPLLAMLQASPWPAFLAGTAAWEAVDVPDGLTVAGVEFPVPGTAERLGLWRAALGGMGVDATGFDLAALSGRFRLTGGQIAGAAAAARGLAYARTPDAPVVTGDDLAAACRRRSSGGLAALARRVPTRHTWDDIVLPADRTRQLQEIHDRIRHRSTVHETWGFGDKVAGGGGIGILFTGPPGTGKTMAAGVLAGALGLDLYKIDLSTMVSKYIGETEKNLSRVFEEAERGEAVLFFDEADALFGKRTQVRDAHDRYANLETSYLLQKMEEHEGVVVLATNLSKNMDDAFVRRLHFTVDFPVPGTEDRLRIWTRVWPREAPLDPGLDLERLAREVDLPGGNIRNIALTAAFLAAADGGTITMAHLHRAVAGEYQKMGKILPAERFTGAR
ncbi:AAA family ATPase [Sphaerisporangium corydalis]|uniref:AAA family ATPase n=1 Tax=Sphaerisporangium corydalis TaxID=1441875 RepID=A0ABV9E7T4_9ACTN|nr:AAA family ATPase [Sphaerisporangium corydalis]